MRPLGGRMIFLRWAAFLVLCLVAVGWKLRVSFDLAYFLPTARTPAEQVVRSLAGDTPGSRMLLILVPGVDAEQAGGNAGRLAARLEALSQIRWVYADVGAAEISAIPAYIWKYRYLLSDQDFSVDGLHQSLLGRLSELMLVGSPEFVKLVDADPSLASLQVVQRLGAGGLGDAVIVPGPGDQVSSLILAETRAPAFDLQGQAGALEQIREAAQLEHLEGVELLGMGVYGLAVQENIRSEAMVRSALATLVVIGIVWIFFRRLSLALASGIPLALGFVAGLAAVALIFGSIHGITLAFGFTLLGVTIDYPLHVLSHAAEHGPAAGVAKTWPIIRLGALSTAIGYGALALTGSPGLAQLGVFSAVGTLTAAFAVKTLFPLFERLMDGDRLSAPSHVGQPPGGQGGTVFKPSNWLWPVLLTGSCIYLALAGTPVWDNSLASMSPVPAQVLARDARLRKMAGSPSMRYLLAVRGQDLEEVLQRSEELDRDLQHAVDQGMLEGWVSVSMLLPSDERQRERLLTLPDAGQLRANLATAKLGLPFKASSFESFVSSVDESRTLRVDLQTLQDSDLAGLAQGMLYQDGDGWVSLVALHGTLDSSALEQFAAGYDDREVFLVDLVQGSQSLLQHYRTSATRVMALASVFILILLGASVKDFRTAVWVMATTATSVLLTVALLHLVAGSLSVFHFVSLLMIAGIGLDYGLFVSSPEGAKAATRRSLLACMITTSATFAILGFSEVPVLNAIGSTVATGVVICYGLTALLGARRNALPPG